MFCPSQVLQWIQQPTDLNGLRDFQEWKEKCDVKVSCGTEECIFDGLDLVSKEIIENNFNDKKEIKANI